MEKKLEKKRRRIQKLADLQGFVSESQIKDLSTSPEEYKELREYVDSEDISVNTFVRDTVASGRTEKTGYQIAKGERPDTGKKSDPVWLYLKNIGRVPLLSKEDEIKLSGDIEEARRNMLKLAYKSGFIHDALCRIGDQIKEGVLEPIDIFGVYNSDEGSIEEKTEGFLKELSNIKRKWTCIKKLRDKAGSTADDDSGELLEKIDSEREDYAERCVSLDLNHIQTSRLLDMYHTMIKEMDDKEALRAYRFWERKYEKSKYRIIEANVRLVVSIAKKYMYSGIEITDLIQEGNRGLIKAVDNFNHHKGYKFSTYATWWIKQTIKRSLNEKSNTIRLPSNAKMIINKIKTFANEYQWKYGATPTYEEIAENLNISLSKVKSAFNYNFSPVSLDKTLNEEDSVTVGDKLADEKRTDPLTQVSYDNLHEKISEVLSSLDEIERKILIMRFGLDDGRTKTLKEVGDIFGVSRERVRQIEIKAMNKLKYPQRLAKLKAWAEEPDEFDNIN